MARYEKPESYGEYDPSPFVDDPIAFYEEMLSDENLKRAESLRETNPAFYRFMMRRLDDARERLKHLKSEEAKRLEELAKTLPKAHEDFVRFMGIMPQKHEVEEEMLKYLETETEADITTEDALYCFYHLTKQ